MDTTKVRELDAQIVKAQSKIDKSNDQEMILLLERQKTFLMEERMTMLRLQEVKAGFPTSASVPALVNSTSMQSAKGLEIGHLQLKEMSNLSLLTSSSENQSDSAQQGHYIGLAATRELGKKDRTSYGSKSSGSANPTQRLISKVNELIRDEDGHEIYFSAQRAVKDIEKFIDLSYIDEATFCSLTNSPRDPVRTRITTLSGENERILQENLKAKAGLLHAIDTHSKNSAIEFLPAREFAGGQRVYTSTGRADLTSRCRRMVFEVKCADSSAALLLQMLQRVTASMDMSHMLLNSIAFGATPSKSYIIIGVRHLPDKQKNANFTSLHFWRVKRDLMFDLWMKASRAPIENFVTADGIYLWAALMAANVNPWLCRVHLHSWSQHRVYDVTLPEVIYWPDSVLDADEGGSPRKSSTCLGVQVGKPSFALKVVLDGSSFEREVAALNQVKPVFFKGSFSRMSTSISNLGRVHARAHICQNRDDSCWWSRSPMVGDGGVLFMAFGDSEAVRQDLDLKKIYDDCARSLRRLHSRGFCHTDVRLANIVRFDGNYEVVDFGEVVPCKTVVDISSFSNGRLSLLPSTIIASDSLVIWSANLDTDMLTHALLDQCKAFYERRDLA